MTKTYQITGMTCSGCAQAVHNLLSKVEGVENADVQLEKKQAVLEMDKTIPTEVLAAVLQNSPYRLSESK